MRNLFKTFTKQIIVNAINAIADIFVVKKIN